MEFCAFVEPKEESLEIGESHVCKIKRVRELENKSCIASDDPCRIMGGSSVLYIERKAKNCPAYTTDKEIVGKVILGMREKNI